MDAFDRFRQQLIQSDLGDLRTRQKTEFFAKVSGHSYQDEMRKLSSAVLRPASERLARSARMRRYSQRVNGR